MGAAHHCLVRGGRVHHAQDGLLREPSGMGGPFFYLGLAWAMAPMAIPIFRRHGFAHLAPLFYGGAAYSIGAFMEYMRWLVVIRGVVHAHEIWHVMVLAGASLHWWFVWNVVGDDIGADPAGVRADSFRG